VIEDAGNIHDDVPDWGVVATIVHGEHTYLRVAAAAEHTGPE
jgi:putative heme iron utilization protein